MGGGGGGEGGLLLGHPGKVVGGSGRRSIDITRGDSQPDIANIFYLN